MICILFIYLQSYEAFSEYFTKKEIDHERDYTFLHYCEDCFEKSYKNNISAICPEEIETTIHAMRKSVKLTFAKTHSYPSCREAYDVLQKTETYYDNGAAKEYRISSLKPFSKLKNLKHIYFYGDDSLTDLKPITNLKKLKSLIIHEAPNLQDISPLNSLAHLKRLDLSFCGITDLAQIKDLLPRLEAASFIGNDLEDQEQLSKLKKGIEKNFHAFRRNRSYNSLIEFYSKK